MTCYCRELGPLSLRSGDICRFCEKQEALGCSTGMSAERKHPGFTKEDLEPMDYDRARADRLTMERLKSALEWKAISPHICQYCGKAAAYEHPTNGYVCSSCPRFG